jgi:type II secretory pathway component PulF
MNYEEFSFFNQQLGAMLKSGLPLEGSLQQISASMNRGELRTEVELLQRDLSEGVPLDEAISRRKLPELYTALVRVGLKSNDLPGVLTMVADYYRSIHNNWTRLKGLLVYPAIVLVTSLLVSGFLAVLYTSLLKGSWEAFELFGTNRGASLGVMILAVWTPVILISIVAAAFAGALSVRQIRYKLRWRVPGFREASLAQFASAMSLMLENGCDVKTALELVEKNEANADTRSELRVWRDRLAAGTHRFADIAVRSRLAPPLFIWLVAGAGENWALGFRRAADVYGARANHRIEVALYAALPVAILFVAAIVATEMAPVMQGFLQFMNALGSDGLGE